MTTRVGFAPKFCLVAHLNSVEAAVGAGVDDAVPEVALTELEILGPVVIPHPIDVMHGIVGTHGAALLYRLLYRSPAPRRVDRASLLAGLSRRPTRADARQLGVAPPRVLTPGASSGLWTQTVNHVRQR